MLVKQIATAALAFGCSIGIASAEAEVGKAAFTQYCATCHGVDAQGAGDLTEIMTVKVPDLTQLAVNNDGKFPMLEVIHVIDGRTGLRGHGGPMPTYGVQCNWGAQHRDNRAKCTALIGARPPKSTPSHATRNAWGCLASKGTLCTRYNTCGDGQRRKEWRIMPQAARQ